MPGSFSKSNRPRRPGAYFNFEAVIPAAIPVATGSVVAVPFTHDWGPFGEATTVNSFAEWTALYGTGDTQGSRAVAQAFKGEGLGGRGGAGAVVSYRMGVVGTAAKADFDVVNTTPATALTVEARYEGTRGNDLQFRVVDNATDSANDDFIVYDGTLEIERFVYPNADIAALVAKINAGSDWLTATLGTDGVALNTTTYATHTALTGGNDGDTLTATEWTTAEAALAVERFGLLAPANLDSEGGNAAIVASLVSWAQNLNQNGKRFMTVLGGAADETASDAVDRAELINDPDFSVIGVGSIRDTEIEDANGDPVVLSTAEFAPRVAGIMANRGEAQSITYARIRGVELLNGADEADILSAFDGGVIVLSKSTSTTNPVRIEKGLTTFTDDTDEDRPYLIYRSPKYVRTMHGIETEFTEYMDNNVIGQRAVNDVTRDGLVGEMRARLEGRADAGIIQPSPFVGIDQDPPPADEDEFIALVYGVAFGRSLEQVFNTVRVG